MDKRLYIYTDSFYFCLPQLHGLVQANLPSRFETTLKYGDGGTCDSHFSAYHNAEGQQFNTGIVLALAQDTTPWAVEMNTSLKHDYYEKSLDLDLSVQAPVLENPFEGSLLYNLTEAKFKFSAEVGLEEKAMLAFMIMEKENENLNKFNGFLEMDSPWNEPVVVNITGDYDNANVNIFLNVVSTIPVVQSLTIESTISFIYPDETKVLFELNHDEISMLMAYNQKLSRYGLTHELEGSINTFTITYDLKLEWDYYYKPTNVEGKLSLLNLMDRDLEISLILKQEDSFFVSQVSGLWDDQAFKFGYILDSKQPLDWSNDIEILIPGFDNAIKTNLSLNALKDSSQVDFQFHFNSPWTDEHDLRFAITTADDVTDYDFDILRASSSLFKVTVKKFGVFSKDMSHFLLKVTGVFMDEMEVLWQYDVKHSSLASFEFSYGTGIYLQGHSHLKLKDEWINQDFVSYSFTANVTLSEPAVQCSTMLDLKSDFFGDFYMHFNDYSLKLKSEFFNGIIFHGEGSVPDNNYKAELLYKKVGNLIPDFSLRVVANDVDLINSEIKFTSVYPKLDAILTLSYANEDNSTFHSGSLTVTAHFDYDYGIKCLAKLTSNVEGFENHTIGIDTNFKVKESYLGGFFTGHLQLNGDLYQAGANASFTMNFDRKVMLELGGNYNIEMGGESNKADASMIFTLNQRECQLKAVAMIGENPPAWALSLQYRFRDNKLNGYITLGDGIEYTVFLKLDSKILHINLEIVEGEDSSFKVLQGNINWNIRPAKQQINLNFKSDYTVISKITGQLTKRGLAATLKLIVNEEKANMVLRLVEGRKGKPSKLHITVDSDIYIPISTVIDLSFMRAKDNFKIDLVVDWNQEKGWITASFNAGLPEYYLRFVTPFEGFDKFNLTLIAKREKNFNLDVMLEVPQFCFTFQGMSDRLFQNVSVETSVNLECSDSDKYEFIFRYNIAFSEEPLVLFIKLDLNGYTAFEFDGSSKFDENGLGIKAEGTVLEDFQLGATFSGVLDKRNALVNLRIYEPSSNSTHFWFEISFSGEKTEFELEMLQDNTIMFTANYDFSPKKVNVSSKYSHMLLGHPFSLTFSCDGNYGRESGGLDVHFETDKSYYDMDLSAAYEHKKNLYEAFFNFSTPTGNVTAKGLYESTESSRTVTIDMLSNLHSFYDYHYELTYQDNSLKFVSAQDDIEFEFQIEKVRIQNDLAFNVFIDTPYQSFKTFNFSFVYPRPTSPKNTHKLFLNLLSNEDLYMVDIDQKHDSSWRTCSVEVNFFTPYDTFRNTTLYFSYDLDNQVSFGINGRRGHLGVKAIWNILSSLMKLKVTTDLSYFHQGEFVLNAEIPFDISQGKGFRLVHQKSNNDFDLKVVMSEGFKSGLFSIEFVNSMSGKENTTYSVQYIYDGKFNIQCHFDKYATMISLETYGYPQSPMAGKLTVNTNIENDESFEVTWNINQQGSIYKAEVQIEINEESLIIFDATLDSQAHYTTTPWESIKLDVLFESPFTLSHHFHMEYQLRLFTFSASYKYGLDTFYVKFSANVHPSYGTITLMGRLPVYGLSSADFRFGYTIAEQSSINFMISVEETIFETSFAISSSELIGSFKTSFTSPFINPLGLSLTWSHAPSAMFFEMKSLYGSAKGNIKINLKYTDTFADFEVEIVPNIFEYATGLRVPTRIAGLVKYDVSDLSKAYGAVILTADEHVFEAKSDFSSRKEKASLNIYGLVDILGISANVTLATKKSKDAFEISVSGDVSGLKPFSVRFSIDTFQLQFSWDYDSKNIIDAMASYDNAKVVFFWDKRNNFNITAYNKSLKKGLDTTYDKSLKKGHEIGLEFVNHNMQTITLQAWYVQTKGNRFNLAVNSSWTDPLVLRAAYQGNKISLKLKYGEKEYNVNTKFIFHPVDLKATIDVHFDSTEDPLNPLVLSAFYDLKDFKNGNMRALKNITYVSLKWGKTTNFLLQGLRKPNHVKLVAEANTPFKDLPKLSIGAGWELINNDRYFLLDFAGYVEWSEKISLDGLTKVSKDLRLADIKWSLNTPFALLKEFSAGVQWKEGHLESMLSYNNNKWRLSCDYELNPFSCSVSLETPLPGLETITSMISVDQRQKFEIHADLSWPESNTIAVTITIKRTSLEVGLITPWSPIKKVLFFMSASRERDKAQWSATLQWDERRVEMSFTISALNYGFSFEYFKDTERTGLLKGTFTITNQKVHFEIEMMTPFDVVKKFDVLFDLSHREFSLKFNINESKSEIDGIFTPEMINIKGETPYLGNLSGAVEVSRNWEQMSMYALFLYSEGAAPYNASFTYKLEDYPFSFKSAFEIKSDETLVSVLIDVIEDVVVTIDVLENYLELKLLVPSQFEQSLHAHFESKDLNLESMNFDLNVKYGSRMEFFNATGTLAFKLKDQFLSRHELVLHSLNTYEYVSVAVELFSDYFSDPYEVKVKIPLFNIFSQNGIFDVSVSQGSKQLYRLYCETVLQNRWSLSQQMLGSIALPEWEANFKFILSPNSLSVHFTYPEPSTDHTFFLSWTNDPERFAVAAEVTSPYLDEGEYKFNLKLNLRGAGQVKLESELIVGTLKTQLGGELMYSERQQKVKFEIQFLSDIVGNLSIEFDVSWEETILVTGKLALQENEHGIQLEIDTEKYTVELIMSSPALSQGTIVITGKLQHYYDTYLLEGKYKSDETEYHLEGNVRIFSSLDFKLSASVHHFEKEVFKIEVSFLAKDDYQSPKIRIIFDIQSVLKELNTYFSLYFVSDSTTTNFEFQFTNDYIVEEMVSISIAINRHWTDPQEISVISRPFQFHFTSKLRDTSSLLAINTLYGYNAYNLLYKHTNFLKDASISIETTSGAIEKLLFKYSLTDDVNDVKFALSRDDKEMGFDFILANDRLIGKAITINVITPFEGYEKFSLQTPQSKDGHPSSFIFMIEYPNGKVGFEYAFIFKGWSDAYTKLILCLPYEENEIISLQYVFDREGLTLETRLGKFGFTFSLKEDLRETFAEGIHFLLRLNDYMVNILFKESWMRNRVRISIHADVNIPEYEDLDSIDLQMQLLYDKQAQIVLRSNIEEYLNLHFGWKPYKVFTVATPRWYPGYVHVNFENNDDLDDYRVEVGIAPRNTTDIEQSWDVYGFQVHQDLLNGGRHMMVAGEAFGGQFSAGVTLALDSLHFNNSLVFEINRKKMGFEILFQNQPGVFTDAFIKDISVILPNQTIHWNTSAEWRTRQFDLSSRFTWSEYDIDMPPITLEVAYDDNSLFDEEDHTFSVVLNHPQVDLITFNGNLTKVYDTPLTGLGELIDRNAPERNIVMMFTLDSDTEYGEQNLLINVSQPYSNFSLNMEAQVLESIFKEAEYSLKYWSLSQESVQEVYISTVCNAADNQVKFALDVYTPESDWGYSYEGMAAYYLGSEASFSLQGISKEFGDYWVFGATATTYLPELEMKLQIGQEDKEPFETGRLRVGLHSPLEIGAILDHQRFGTWEQDGHLGLNLKSPSILQFLFEYDPSLDPSDDNFAARLTSPADQIWDSWSRDINSTLSSFKTFIMEEMPFVKEALINQETIDVIWMREEDNIEYLNIEFVTAISDMQEDIVYIWSDVLVPAWEATYNFAVEM